MKITIIAIALIFVMAICAGAEEDQVDRYKFYSVKSGVSELTLLLDSSTGKTWQVSVDATGKVTNLAAVTVEGLAYTPKDIEKLYSNVNSMNIDGLSMSNSAVKDALFKLYGYGLDPDKLVAVRDKAKTSAEKK
jgi:hypothetical protein